MSRYSAFLSYSRRDAEKVEALRAALESRNLTAWFDRSEIVGGDIWEAVIRRALTQSDTLVVFVSENIVGSYVENEIRLAQELRKTIIPLALDGAIDRPDDIIKSLRRYHFIDLRSGFEDGVLQAVSAIDRSHKASVISTYNIKGGVGKTTITLQLATYFFKRANKRVLVIDSDPQTNLSTSLVLPQIERARGGLFGGRRTVKTDVLKPLQDTGKSILGVLEESFRIADQTEVDFNLNRYVHTLDEGPGGAILDIVVGDSKIRKLATEATPSQSKKAINGFARFVGQCRKNYDLIFIDMNPSISTLSKCSLAATTHILSPVKPDSYSIQGLNLLEEISQENDIDAHGCEQIILINDPREDQRNIVRGHIEQSAFADRLLGPDFVYSRHFWANPAANTNASLSNFPAYGTWSDSVAAHRKSLKGVAEALAGKIGLQL